MVKSIKKRLADGEMVRVMAIGQLPSPKLIEITGIAGNYHGVWLDQEHSAIPHHQLELLMMACRAAGLDAFVRVPPTDYPTIMRPMEAGAGGVMAAQIRTIEQVEQIVQWAKYPPIGVRGHYSANFESGYGTRGAVEQIEQANRDGWLSIQIETPEAVEIADQIAATAGVDTLFVGPGDLSCTLGVPGQVMHPKCIAALERVAAACDKADKTWGILSRTPEHADKCRELGCRLFSLSSDISLLHAGFAATHKTFAEYFR